MHIKRVLAAVVAIAALAVSAYVFYSFNPEEYPFPKCPIYTLTGYKCPGCGMQRMLHHLLHGDIAGAFACNALLFIVLPYILFGLFIEYIAPRNAPLTKRLRNLFFNTSAALILAALFIAFTVRARSCRTAGRRRRRRYLRLCR